MRGVGVGVKAQRMGSETVEEAVFRTAMQFWKDVF